MSQQFDERLATPGERLKGYRLKKGLDVTTAANHVGIPAAYYYDLEGHNDLEDNLSIGEIKKLADLLGVKPWQLFADNAPPAQVSCETMRDKLVSFLKDNNIKIEEFEDRVGWELQKFVNDPEAEFFKWNIDCLKDVSEGIGLDWLSVLP